MAYVQIPDKNYFSISEVSKITGVKPYVLRYWESEFKLLIPPRRDSGQRKYRRKDVNLVLRIKELLHDKKFTIAGAKRFLLDEYKKGPKQLNMAFAEDSAAIETLRTIKKELTDITKLLK